MTTFVDDSDIDESQASHLLHRVLDVEDIQAAAAEDDPSSIKETQRSPSPNSTFNFHGLGQTQTQQFDEEVDYGRSSQKENMEAHKVSLSLSISMATKSIKRNPKSVSFQSPHTTTKTPLPRLGHHSSPQVTTARPSTDSDTSSQDSFGVAIPDPKSRFLATSEAFNKPLAELADFSSSNTGGSSSIDNMYSSRNTTNRFHQSPSLSEGKILVESTPSASGSSQSYAIVESQLKAPEPEQGQANEEARIDLANYSTDECLSDAPSSGYNPYEDRDDDPTPAISLEATQPSTQVEDESGMSVDRSHPFDAPVQNSVQSTSTTTTHSKNLLSLVDPKKRYRYQQHLDSTENEKYAQRLTNAPNESSTGAYEETQPSFEPETQESIRLLQRGRFPVNANAKKSTSPSKTGTHASMLSDERQHAFASDLPVSNLRYSANRPKINAPLPSKNAENNQVADTLEIIPDSEPSRNELEQQRNGKHNSPPSDPSRYRRFYEIGLHKVPEDREMNMELEGSLSPIDEEEDVPLASKLALKQGAKDVTATKSESPSRGQDGRTNRLNVTNQASTSNARSGKAAPRSMATRTKTHSEIPEQDFPTADAGSPLPGTTAVTKGKGKLSTLPRTTLRSSNTAAKSRAVPQTPVSEEDDQDDDEEASEDDATDQEYMDPKVIGSISKRKRDDGSAQRGKATKAVSRNYKRAKRLRTTTPVSKQVGRSHSAPSTTYTSDCKATRVFALWKQDGHFYPGTVHSHLHDSVYTVHFDDDTEGRVNIDQMRTLDLREGDDVLIPKMARGVKIVDVSKLGTEELVSVLLDSAVVEVELQALKIASKTISCDWKDRVITYDALAPIVKPERGKPSPTPSKSSVATGLATRSHGRAFFDKTAFVVTVSPNVAPGKDNVASLIKNAGGTVINEWSDVINMEGKHYQSNNKWVINQTEVQWRGTDDIQRIFLVADDSSLKPKFLIALALGVPCVSTSWVQESANFNTEQEWTPHMLPQGYSEPLGARASQQVDFDWGNSVHHLKQIMENKVACKLFNKKSILCVGPEIVPANRSRKNISEKAQEARNAVTRIILSMGAKRVEAVTEITYASYSIATYDYVVIKEPTQYKPDLQDGHVVTWAWVKDCLIASRLLPVRERLPVFSESQDA